MATVLEQAERMVGRTTCDWPTLESVAEVVREARNAAADVRHATKDTAERIELAARRRPLAAVGVAAAAGSLRSRWDGSRRDVPARRTRRQCHDRCS